MSDIETAPLSPRPTTARCIACPICLGENFRAAVNICVDKLFILLECLNQECGGYRLTLDLGAVALAELLPWDGMVACGETRIRT